MTGVYHSKSVHTSKVAGQIPGQAQRTSQTRRLSRFLNNKCVNVREWYAPTARHLLAEAAQSGEIRLIIDATKVAQNHQLLMVALAYRRRALPVAWTWILSAKRHSSGRKQAALLQYVHELVPADAPVVLTGDSEFTPLQPFLQAWQWDYVLRQKGNHLYRQQPRAAWQRLDTLLSEPGQQRWLPAVELTERKRTPCNLLAHWQLGEKEPWLLATNLPTPKLALRSYRVRPWFEEMFGDFKSNGADLERSHLQHFLRLSRLTLVVALLYVWIVAFGATTIKRSRRALVDRSDRRDLTIFRLPHGRGFGMLQRCLINYLPISIRAVPYFT